MRVAATVVLYRPDLASLSLPLARLLAWSAGPVLVHVNAEDDGEVASAVRSALPQATVTSTSANLGFAGGHNALAEQAFRSGCDAVLVHNPDLVLDAGALAGLEQALASLGRRVLVGPLLELADPRTFEGEARADSLGVRWTRSGRHLDAGQGDPLTPPVAAPPVRVAALSGACLLVPREAYDVLVETTGELFDSDFVAFREDAELGFRAALVGVPSYLVPCSRGRHARGNRGTVRGRSAHIDRLGVRNRFLIAFKYGRHRPGGVTGPLLRDVVVVLGVLLRERSSLPGLAEAWQLRKRMREKGRRVLRAAVVSSHQATHPGL